MLTAKVLLMVLAAWFFLLAGLQVWRDRVSFEWLACMCLVVALLVISQS